MSMTPVASATKFEGRVGLLTVAGLVLQQQGNAAAWAEPSKSSIRECSIETSCGFVPVHSPSRSRVTTHVIQPRHNASCPLCLSFESLLRILQIVR